LDNYGAEKIAVAVSVIAPADWEVENETEYFNVDAGGSTIGSFGLTPTASAGAVSLYIEYPYQEEVINFTRSGPYLQSATVNITTTTAPANVTAEKPLIVEVYESIRNSILGAWQGLKDMSGGLLTEGMLTPLTLGIIAVLVIIIAWLVWGIIGDIRGGVGKKPEQMKKQAVEAVPIVDRKNDVLSGIDKL
jgi:hypothetical protein